MIRELGEESGGRLAVLWQSAYPRKWNVHPSVLRRNLLESSQLLLEASGAIVPASIAADGTKILQIPVAALAIKQPPSKTPERAHVSYYARTVPRWDADELWRQATRVLRALGVQEVVIGMDYDHVLPGCPDEWPDVTAELQARGFVEFGRCFDLERDLGDYELPKECEQALHDHRASVRPCSPQDRDALDSYFARVFPGRWRHDVMRKHGEEPDQVYVLEIDGQILGHAMTQQQGCKRPVAGAVWHLSLGDKWGALGSIGIDSVIRGKGLGNALLGKALQNLQARGARQTIIDWTTLGDFYGAHGFAISRRYVQMALDLSTL